VINRVISVINVGKLVIAAAISFTSSGKVKKEKEKVNGKEEKFKCVYYAPNNQSLFYSFCVRTTISAMSDYISSRNFLPCR